MSFPWGERRCDVDNEVLRWGHVLSHTEERVKIKIRLLIMAIAAVCALGLAGVSGYYLQATGEYDQKHQPTRIDQEPRFLYPITGGARGAIESPLGVYAAAGKVYLTSATGHLLITDREGRSPERIDLSAGAGTGLSPRSVVVDEGGRTYVAVGPINKILLFDQAGRRVSPDFGAGIIVNPVGLGLKNDKIFVTDVGDHSVKILTRGGKLVRKIGGPGSGEGRLSYPNGLAVADDGTIYVADSNNSRVQLFDGDGRFLRVIADGPSQEDKMLLPRDVAIDKLGRVHVLDTLRSRVFVFSEDDKFLFSYGADSDAGGSLAYPQAISIETETGLVYIADRKNNRVAVWGTD